MAKKVKLQAKATEKISADEKQKNLKSMVKHGEILSNVLIENLSQYGNSLEGLLMHWMRTGITSPCFRKCCLGLSTRQRNCWLR